MGIVAYVHERFNTLGDREELPDSEEVLNITKTLEICHERLRICAGDGLPRPGSIGVRPGEIGLSQGSEMMLEAQASEVPPESEVKD